MSAKTQKHIKNTNSEKINILMYSNSHRPFSRGGAELMFHGLVDSMRQRGYRVDTMYSQRKSQYVKGDKGDVWILPIDKIEAIDGIGKFVGLAKSYKTIIRIFSVLTNSMPNVVYVNYISKEVIYFSLLQQLFGYRLVLGAVGSDILVPKGKNYNFDIQKIVASSDSIITVSKSIKDKIKTFDNTTNYNIHCVYNGIDLDYWTSGSAGNREEYSPMVLSVGRLERVKGHDILIEAFCRVIKHIPLARLILAGDGRERDNLESMVDRKGIRDSVSFLGALGHDEVRSALYKSDIFAMPSRSEGFGLAALEAMAAGLPVIGFAVGGLPEVVDSESGILVSPENPIALADALVSVLSDDNRRDELARGAHNRAKCFSWERTVDAYEHILKGEAMS